MKIVELKIRNFRNIKKANLSFDGNCLLVGSNNVGKSTVCEAIDLVLGPDRINRFPPIQEFDFYNGKYVKGGKKGLSKPIQLSIKLLLIDISDEVENRCGQHIEFWHKTEKRILRRNESHLANTEQSQTCLRLETIGFYNIEEDEFEAQTYFSHSPSAPEGELVKVGKVVKRMFGFLYLRTIRTGSRALSLERGSLLDIILRMQDSGTRGHLWESAINRLKDLDIEKDAEHLEPVLKSIEERLGTYISTETDGRTTKLYVSQLTREHLRKTLSFFLRMSEDQKPVPFQQVGAGTLNILVLALLSFIADLKPSSVIFAMEEPEIALPPHTQRRVTEYLLNSTSQAFVTSHSPFVIERFQPDEILLLSRTKKGKLTSNNISNAVGELKSKDFHRYARRGLTESMLGKAAIVVEGLTEFHAIPVVAQMMEEADDTLQPLDISGVVFFDAETESNMPKFGKFFRSLGLKTYAFYDHIKGRAQADKKKMQDSYDLDFEHKYKGFEQLLTSELSVERLWSFLDDLRESGDNGSFTIPESRPEDKEVIKLTTSALKKAKGVAWSARLLENCLIDELPVSITGFLKTVYKDFPKKEMPDLNSTTSS